MAVPPAEVEPAPKPLTSVGGAVDVVIGRTSAVVAAAEMEDVTLEEAGTTGEGVTREIGAVDPHLETTDTEEAAEVIQGRWKDAKEGVSFASKRVTSRHTAPRKAAEEET